MKRSFRRSGGSRVYSNAESQAMTAAAGAGGNVAYITQNIYGDVPEATAAKIRRDLIRELRDELGMQTLAGPRLPVGSFSPRRA